MGNVKPAVKGRVAVKSRTARKSGTIINARMAGKCRTVIEKHPAAEVVAVKDNPAVGSSWDEVRAELFTPEEIAESDVRVAVLGELIKARQEKGLSQKKLGELSGVRQPVIARMERGITSPQLDTVLKVLAPLGKTLAVVPLEEN